MFSVPSPFSLNDPPSSQKRKSTRGLEVLKPAIKCKEKCGNLSSQREMTAETMIQLLSFKNDGDQSGKTVELGDRKVGLEQLVQHPREGESILIIPKHTKDEKPALSVDEEMERPWYFIHM